MKDNTTKVELDEYGLKTELGSFHTKELSPQLYEVSGSFNIKVTKEDLPGFLKTLERQIRENHRVISGQDARYRHDFRR